MDNISDDILDRSNAIVKQKTGALLDSGAVFNVDSRDTLIRVVHYGSTDPSSEYAEIQHSHPGRGPITRAKPATQDGEAGPRWLSRVFDNMREDNIDRIRRAVLRSIRRTVKGR